MEVVSDKKRGLKEDHEGLFTRSFLRAFKEKYLSQALLKGGQMHLMMYYCKQNSFLLIKRKLNDKVEITLELSFDMQKK